MKTLTTLTSFLIIITCNQVIDTNKVSDRDSHDYSSEIKSYSTFSDQNILGHNDRTDEDYFEYYREHPQSAEDPYPDTQFEREMNERFLI